METRTSVVMRRLGLKHTRNPALIDIVEVILDLGGSAHRDAVIKEIAWRRSGMAPTEGMHRELLAAFDAHREAAERAGKPALIQPAFGPESRRWALTPEAREVLAAIRNGGHIEDTRSELDGGGPNPQR